VAFTRNPFDTSVSPATYTAEGPSALFLDEQPKDIAIDGSEGKDTINVNASKIETRSLTNYNVRGFEGDDTFVFNALTITNSVINGNVGDDTMTIGNFVSNPTVNFEGSYFLGGKGEDTLTANDLSNGEVNGNMGNDTLNINNLFADDSSGQYIGGGQGNDVINVAGDFTDSIIDGNKGIDTITVANGDHSGTSINGGEGNDIIRSFGDASKGLMMSGNLGNDTIRSVGNLGSTVFGGEGNDTIVSASVVGETSSIDAGIGADLVGTENSAAVETIIFNAGDSVAATASSIGFVPGAAISGTVTFGNGIDIITGLTGGFNPAATNDLIDIDFKPADFTLLNAPGVVAPNTLNLDTDVVYALQGDYVGKTFTIGNGAGDNDYLYIVGGPNTPLGAAFDISTNMFISGSLIAEDQFI